MELGSGLVLTGFVGGLSGYDPAGNVTLDIGGTLAVQGGIVAADAENNGHLQLIADAITTEWCIGIYCG